MDKRLWGWWPCGGCGGTCESDCPTIDLGLPELTHDDAACSTFCGGLLGTYSLAWDTACEYSGEMSSPPSCFTSSTRVRFFLIFDSTELTLKVEPWTAFAQNYQTYINGGTGIQYLYHNPSTPSANTVSISPTSWLSDGDCSAALSITLSQDVQFKAVGSSFIPCKWTSGQVLTLN